MVVKKVYDSLQSLQEESLRNNFLIYSSLDGQNNKYEAISFPDEGYLFGLAYYSLGIESQTVLIKEMSKLLIGFGQTIIGVDCNNQKELFRKEAISPFYEFIATKHCILAIFELDIYAYDTELNQIWVSGFRDIIVDHHIVDSDKILIECADGERFTFTLKDGSQL